MNFINATHVQIILTTILIDGIAIINGLLNYKWAKATHSDVSLVISGMLIAVSIVAFGIATTFMINPELYTQLMTQPGPIT